MRPTITMTITFVAFMSQYIFCNQPAHARYRGADLLQDCKLAMKGDNSTIEKSFQTGRCIGIVIGIARAGDSKGLLGSDASAGFCINNDVLRNENLIKFVVTYLTTHPEVLDTEAADLVVVALLRNFPC